LEERVREMGHFGRKVPWLMTKRGAMCNKSRIWGVDATWKVLGADVMAVYAVLNNKRNLKFDKGAQ
jgi:hypothetical protein